ncbi:DUF6903 family protein [Hydrogenoanaerobacterium sp.]|uniref:DUF6903 family protein n=1 Tax=Hydrogenoanaerobacterium sp. TaxID=2953763 RepID=UPI00289F6467|nr:hypothetical protein [Hydrogenoanaerobacterium sp.]
MEYMRKKLLVLAGLVALVFFTWLVIIGHRAIGYSGLGLMTAGLAGILALLFIYNRQYTK